ncbi:hypothetical protein AB0K80_12270 [Streptomyces sp. NPDC052682]|uniref:hypothetical protein n=1 Tax=Streptomyces sp. NPDC052682 TaxID=3154954 RepID=UPI00344836DE
MAFAAVAAVGLVRCAPVGAGPAPERFVLTGTLLFGCVLPGWAAGTGESPAQVVARAAESGLLVGNGPVTGQSSRRPPAVRRRIGPRGRRAAVTAAGGTFAAGAHGEGFRVPAYVPDRVSGLRAAAPGPAHHLAGTLRLVRTTAGSRVPLLPHQR